MHTAFMPAAAVRLLTGLLAVAALAGCAATASGPDAASASSAASAPDLLLLGETHDAPGQAERVTAEVEALAARGQLAALALEMAPAGTTTIALPRDASDAALRAALQWDARAWPWERYAGAIRAAVRAGVPVVGANLPAAQNSVAMQDVSLDVQLSDAARVLQEAALREGHCGLLPARRLPALLRVQTARDREMAHIAAQSVRAGATVVLWAGSGHVDRRVGVPQHLPTQLSVRAVALVPGLVAGVAEAGAAGASDAATSPAASSPASSTTAVRAPIPAPTPTPTSTPTLTPNRASLAAPAPVPAAAPAPATAREGFDAVWPTPAYTPGDVCAPLRTAPVAASTPAPAGPPVAAAAAAAPSASAPARASTRAPTRIFTRTSTRASTPAPARKTRAAVLPKR